MDLIEKIGYLKGLMDGLDLDKNSKEAKIFSAIIETLDDMADSIEMLNDSVTELEELTDILDEDLGALEDDYYDDGDCDCDCGCDCDCDDCDCEDCDCDDDDDFYYEVVCGKCNDTICLDEGMIEEGSINCPNCGELLEFDLEDEGE